MADLAGRPSRRQFLTGGAAFVGGAAVGAVARDAAVDETTPDDGAVTADVWASDTLPFWGAHQPGVETPAAAASTVIALDLRDGVDREGAARLLRLWTDDAARLMSGSPALADMEPELASRPSRLAVTMGFGPSFFQRLGLEDQRPPGLVEIPPLPIDRLQDRWSGGDLVLQVGADDQVTLAHATRLLLRDGRAFAQVRWVQRGFREARGATPEGATGRNLFGQVDGTVNPEPGTDDFAKVVWASDGPEWFKAGTTMVVRRIRFDLDGWDALDRDDRELAIGRRLSDGAPLTGGTEDSTPDLQAEDELGMKEIPEFAHVRRARARNADERFLRRGYSYDDAPERADEISETGLIFCTFQADIARQFVPVQRRLASLDLLNTWTTPIGSAVFAIPPGVAEGDWIGSGLLAGT
jgi:dye decolorizing peroxidase